MLRSVRRVLLAVVAILVLAVCAVVVATLLVLPSPEFQQWVSRELSESVGEEIEFGAISLAFWPAPGIRLYEIGLGDSDGAASVDSVSCTFSLGALLRGEVEVARIYVERPVLGLRRNASGEWVFEATLQDVLDRIARTKRASQADDDGPGEQGIPLLFIRDGSVDFADDHVEGGPVTLPIRNLSAMIDLSRHDHPGRVQVAFDAPAGAHLDIDAKVEPRQAGAPLAQAVLQAQVGGRSLESDRFLPYLLFGLPIRNSGGAFDIEGSVSGSIATGLGGRATLTVQSGRVEAWGIHAVSPVRITSDFAVHRGDFSLTGAHLEASAAGLDRFQGEPADAVFGWSNSTLTLEQLTLPAYGGVWTGQGSVVFRGSPSYDMSVRAEKVDFRELMSFLVGEDVQQGFETLEVSADLRGSWPETGDWWSGLGGAGTLKFRGGEIDSSPLYKSIFRALVTRIPGMGHLLVREKAKRPNILDHLGASFEIENGVARTEDLAMATSDYRLEGKGSSGFDGSVDLVTRVSFTSRGLNEFYRLASLRTRNPEDPNIPAIPVRITGTLDEPNIVPDLAKLPLTPFHVLFDTAEGAVDFLKNGPIRKGIGRIFRGKYSPPAGEDASSGSGVQEGDASSPAVD